MNKVSNWYIFAVQAFIFLTLWSLASCRQSQVILSAVPENGVLIINSDKSVEKYATIQQEFKLELAEANIKTTQIDFGGEALSARALRSQIANIQPYIVYTIGSKAYTQASTIVKNKPLLFSSMINWRRFSPASNTYGVALELPAEMQLLMYSYLFPEVHSLGVLYSKNHNSQWFELAIAQTQEVGLSLYGKTVESADEISNALQELLPKIDALWLISDPIVLHDTKQVQQIFSAAAASKKPIFAYSTIFSQHGAVLTIAADIPTMGRQAADLVQNILANEPIDNEEKIQFPAGSHVTLNLKKVHEYGIKINHAALSSVENIIQ
jgi:putative ABC transport system substrate-binding protein